MLALFIGLFHFRGKPLRGRLVVNVADNCRRRGMQLNLLSRWMVFMRRIML